MNMLLHGVYVPNVVERNSLAVRLTEIGDSERVDVILTNPPFGGEEEASIKNNFPADKQTAETALLFLQLIMRRLRRAGHEGKRGGRAAVVVPNGTLFADGVAARIKEELLTDFNLHTVLRLPRGVFSPYTDIQTNVLFFDRNGKTGDVWFYEHIPPGDRKNYTKTRRLEFEEFGPFIEWRKDRQESDRAWKVPVGHIVVRDGDKLISADLDMKNPHSVEALERKTYGELLAELSAREHEISTGLAALRVWSSPTDPLQTISDILTLRRDVADLDPERAYKRVTVRLHHKGAVLRDEVSGDAVGSSKYLARAGQVIVSRIDARHGAIAIVPPELDGAVVSSDFLTYDIREDVDSDYLDHYFETLPFRLACDRASVGSTNRVRLQEDRFATIPVPLSNSHSDQKRVVAQIDGRLAIVERVQAFATQNRAAAGDLYAAAIREVITTFEATRDADDVDSLLDELAALGPLDDRANNATPGSNRDADPPFELGPGWRWTTLGALTTHIVDCVNDTPEFSDRPTPYLGLKTTNVRANRIVLDETWYVTEDDWRLWNRRLEPTAGDLILTREAPMGFVAEVPTGLVSCLTQRLVLLRTSHAHVLPRFLVHMLNDRVLMDEATRISKSTPPHMRVRDIPRLTVPICGRQSQSALAERLDEAFEQATLIKHTAEERVTDLVALRRAVYTRAFAAVD